MRKASAWRSVKPTRLGSRRARCPEPIRLSWRDSIGGCWLVDSQVCSIDTGSGHWNWEDDPTRVAVLGKRRTDRVRRDRLPNADLDVCAIQAEAPTEDRRPPGER